MAANAGQAQDNGGRAFNTNANYTPGNQLKPLSTSTDCPGEESGRTAEPFKLPTAYNQQVIAEESDPGVGPSPDNWDMNTQNEFGKDAGRYVYRTHENRGNPSQVSVTDLKTGETKLLATRPDWEAFDGIVWTPWGTILAAEETTKQALPDPQVPEAEAGLVYEFFVDKDDPTVLDPSREPSRRTTEPSTPYRTASGRVRLWAPSLTRACASTSRATTTAFTNPARVASSASCPTRRATFRRARLRR